MKTKTRFRVYLIIAIVFIILSVVIFILAEGLRKWYSGLFFLIMGIVALANAIYQNRNIEKDT